MSVEVYFFPYGYTVGPGSFVEKIILSSSVILALCKKLRRLWAWSFSALSFCSSNLYFYPLANTNCLNYVIFSGSQVGMISSTGDIWLCLKTVLVVTTIGQWAFSEHGPGMLLAT